MVPGVSVAEPVDVAREGLENLANGPVFIAGGNAAASPGISLWPFCYPPDIPAWSGGQDEAGLRRVVELAHGSWPANGDQP